MLLFVTICEQHALHIRTERHRARTMFKVGSFGIGQADGEGFARTGNVCSLPRGDHGRGPRKSVLMCFNWWFQSERISKSAFEFSPFGRAIRINKLAIFHRFRITI